MVDAVMTVVAAVAGTETTTDAVLLEAMVVPTTRMDAMIVTVVAVTEATVVAATVAMTATEVVVTVIMDAVVVTSLARLVMTMIHAPRVALLARTGIAKCF